MPLGVLNSAAFLTASQLAVAANATIEVRRESDSGLASIFSDRAGTAAITNPSAFADASGRFTLYVAASPGGFSILVTSGAESYMLRNVPIGLGQEFDIVEFWRTVLAAATAAAARLALGFAAIAAKGDSWWGSAADTIVKLTVGANGTVPMARSAAASGMAYVAALNKAIYGLTYDNGTDATNDLNINVGGAMDATGAYWMTLAAALGKQSDVAWAVGGTTGAPAGGLDTGAVGNSDYYIWLIARSDTGVVDALFSLSATAPTMPANYDFKRLIGWFKRVGGAIVAFTTYETEGGGLELLWSSPTLDVDLAATLTTSRRLDVVKVPLGFSVLAHLNVYMIDAASQTTWVYCPDQADLAPSGSAAPLANVFVSSAVGNGASQKRIRTNTSGQIAARSNVATIDNYMVSTMGFEWSRR